MAVNILVADDSVTMRRILELAFQGEDAKITAVESGEVAVRRAAEVAPDVVFADLSMNGMDGYAVASAIKGAPGLERTAVVVMASQKHPYDEEKGRAAGVDDHILKPFDTQHVIDRVKQVLGKPRQAPAARATQPTAASAATAPGMTPANRVGTKTIAFGKPPTAAPVPGPALGGRPQVAAAAPQAASGFAAQPAAGFAPQPQSAAAGFAPQPQSAAAGFAPQPTAAAARPSPQAAPSAASAAVSMASADLEQKLNGLGLTPEQAAAVLSLSREVVERVVWEVVPDLAETLIKEEIRRLTAS